MSLQSKDPQEGGKMGKERSKPEHISDWLFQYFNIGGYDNVMCKTSHAHAKAQHLSKPLRNLVEMHILAASNHRSPSINQDKQTSTRVHGRLASLSYNTSRSEAKHGTSWGTKGEQGHAAYISCYSGEHYGNKQKPTPVHNSKSSKKMKSGAKSGAKREPYASNFCMGTNCSALHLQLVATADTGWFS